MALVRRSDFPVLAIDFNAVDVGTGDTLNTLPQAARQRNVNSRAEPGPHSPFMMSERIFNSCGGMQASIREPSDSAVLDS